MVVACASLGATAQGQTLFTFDNDCGSSLWNHCCAGGLNNVCTVWNNWMSPPNSLIGDCPPCPASPGPIDDVVLNQFVHNDGAVLIHNLTTFAPLRNSGQLNVSGSAVYNAPVASSSTFGGTGQHVFNALLTGQSGCNFYFPSVNTINAGLDVVGGTTVSADVTNAPGSTITIRSSAGSFSIDDAGSNPHQAVLHNQQGALILCEGESPISALFTSGHLINAGIIRKSAGVGTMEISPSLTNSPTGRFEVQSGRIYTSRDATMSGTVDISAGAAFRQGNAITVPSSLTVTGLGEYQMVGTLTIAQGATAVVPRFTTDDGSPVITGAGQLTVTVTGDLDQVSLRQSAQLNVAPGAVATLSGEMYAVDGVGSGPALNVAGTFNWTGSTITFTTGVLHVLPGGALNLPATAALTGSFESGSMLNEGTMRRSLPGNVGIHVPFENRGTVEALAGKVSFASGRQTAGHMRLLGGSFTSPDASEPFLLQGGRLSGTGDFGGGLTNTGGTVAPGSSAGTITITGGLNNQYTQSGAGVLEIEIGGATPGAQYDQLVVRGPAQFGGTLRVSRINGFTGPGVFDVLVLDVPYTRTGQFDTLELPPGASVAYFSDRVRVTLGPACAADIGAQGGVPGNDGLLDNNDFVVFIDYFFNHNPLADRGVTGGIPGSDGEWNNNDFVVFIDQFFAGC
jgi:hypothetical protein